MNLSSHTLAELLLDAYTVTRTADQTTTRSTKEARQLGIKSGRYDGIRAVAETVCRAHGSRINGIVRAAHTRYEAHADSINAADYQAEALRVLADNLYQLATRTTCGDTMIWRDEDLAMARQDLAPFTCLRLPGHDGTCAMHPTVADKLDQGIAVTTDDYLAPIPA